MTAQTTFLMKLTLSREDWPGDITLTTTVKGLTEVEIDDLLADLIRGLESQGYKVWGGYAPEEVLLDEP